MKEPSSRTPVMQIVSQICQDRHPEVFTLKNQLKLTLQASKSKMSHGVLLCVLQFSLAVDLSNIDKELHQLNDEFTV